MKTLTKTLAIVALSASFAAPAFSAVEDDIRRRAGTNGNISIQVEGDTVVLNGYVADQYSRQLAEQTARKQGYEVQNNLIYN